MEERDEVELMKATGMSDPQIAAAMGMSRTTLLKYFADELTNGGARKRRQILGWMAEAAKKGNVSAQKKLLEVSSGPAAPVVDGRPVGKKEAARKAAETAGVGTDWGDDLNVKGQRPN